MSSFRISSIKFLLLSVLLQSFSMPFAFASGEAVSIAMSGPSASTLETGADDAVIINFTIESTEDLTLKNFPISMDFSSDVSDMDAGLLAGASPNLTDIKIVDQDTGDVVFGPTDATHFTSSFGGPYITEVNDTVEAYYIFTDELELSAGSVHNLALTVDIAKESALDGGYFYGSLKLGESYPQMYDTDGIVLDNSSDLVPHSTIISKQMTLMAVPMPSLTLALSSSVPPGTNEAAAGSTDLPFVAFALSCGAESDCLITEVTLQGYFDDDADGNYESSSSSVNDASDHETTMDSIVEQVWLEEDAGIIVSSPQSIPSDYRPSFTGLDWVVPADTTKVLYVKGDLSLYAYANSDAENIAFGLPNYAFITAEDEDGDPIIPTGSANTAQSTYVTTTDTLHSDLTIMDLSVDEDYTLNFRIANAGEEDVDTAGLTGKGVRVKVYNPKGSQVGKKELNWSAIESYITAGGSKKLVRHMYKYDFMTRLKAGKTYTVEVCIDPDDDLAEFNTGGDAEDNNCETTSFLMGELPDLAVTELSYDSPTYTFTSTLANLSDGITVAQIKDGYTVLTLNGTEVDRANWEEAASSEVAYLNAGTTQVVSVTLDESQQDLLVEGENTWEVCVDSENAVTAETSETNNCMSGTFTVDLL